TCRLAHGGTRTGPADQAVRRRDSGAGLAGLADAGRTGCRRAAVAALPLGARRRVRAAPLWIAAAAYRDPGRPRRRAPRALPGSAGPMPMLTGISRGPLLPLPTLVALLLTLALAAAPHALRQPVWLIVLAVTCGVWRYLIARR